MIVAIALVLLGVLVGVIGVATRQEGVVGVAFIMIVAGTLIGIITSINNDNEDRVRLIQECVNQGGFPDTDSEGIPCYVPEVKK